MTNFAGYQIYGDMKIAIFQMDIAWRNPRKNRDNVEKWLEDIDNDVDIVVLPEMFSTGFSMTPEIDAEPVDGETVSWLIDAAQRFDIAIVTSVAVVDSGAYFNRMYFVEPSGRVVCYDKRHLFRMGGENQHYTAGNQRVVVKYKGWRFLLQICYDLRFPVWARNLNDYDAIIYVANWPEVRNDAWEILLKARAVENSCYVIAANRTGRDDKLNYIGNSLILNYKGEVISSNSLGRVEAVLEMEKLNHFREKFPVQLDADAFRIE
jgi:predicted amidohydrolase